MASPRKFGENAGGKACICTGCGKNYTTPRNLKVHHSRCAALHPDGPAKPHTCPFCPMAFVQKYEMVVHVRACHTGEKPYPCSVCNKTFARSGDAKAHLATHSTVKPHACTKCGKRFLTAKYLRVHGETHKAVTATPNNEMPYRCELCKLGMKNKISFREHLKACGKHRQRFPCDQCGATFLGKGNLREHVTDKHKHPEGFSCSHCKKNLASRVGLKWHIRRVHKVFVGGAAAEKQHKCNYCDKAFVTKGEIIVHIRIHTLEKPFGCDSCHNSFASQGNLRRHRLRTHLGIKSYLCETCDSSFVEQGDLDKHLHSQTHAANSQKCKRKSH